MSGGGAVSVSRSESIRCHHALNSSGVIAKGFWYSTLGSLFVITCSDSRDRDAPCLGLPPWSNKGAMECRSTQAICGRIKLSIDLSINKKRCIMRSSVFFSLLLLTTPVFAETWLCQHRDPSRDPLTFTVDGDDVRWSHARLGNLDPLAMVVNNKAMLTMATRRVNILYSRFFHLDKLSGRMGDVTFRPEYLRKLETAPDQIRSDQITTIWRCARQDQSSSPSTSR
jgi:hypothetical protein